MSQGTYELFIDIFDVYRIILQIILFLILWRVFYQWDKEKKALITVVIFVAINIFMGLCLDTLSWIRYIVSAVIILGYSVVKYKKHLEKTVFVLLLFYNFHALSFLIADSIYQYVIDNIWSRLDVGSADYAFQMNQTVVIGYIWLLAVYTLSFLLMLEGVRKIVKKPFSMRWSDVMFLSALNIVGGMLAGMVIDLSVVQIEGGVFLLFDEKREMIWKVPMIAVLVYMGESAAIYIYQNYRGLQNERQKHFVEEQQIKAMKRRLEEAESFYGSIRKVRHEMKNHMINIKGLVASEKYEEVETYIEKLDETIQILDYKFSTGNAVTDVIINDKYRKATDNGISFEVKFNYQKTDTIPVFDIGIILNNLLDNAIEACEKIEQEQCYINLTLKRKSHFLLIEVENSFAGKIRWEEDAAIPLTTKPSELPDILMEHGLGLKNVKDVAERYLGDMHINIKANVFKVTVMLQQKEENYENHNTDVK